MRAIELPVRETRRWWPRFTTIVATATVVVIGAILVVSWTPILRPPVAAAPPDPRAFAGDSRLARCVNGGPDPLAAFEMAHASDYRLHLPAMGLSPELDRPDPAFVVVLGEGSPRGGGGAPGAAGGFVPSASLGAEASGRNVHDVCVLVGADSATAERTVYTDVDTTGLRAFVPAIPSPAATNSQGPSPTPAAEPCRAGDLSAIGIGNYQFREIGSIIVRDETGVRADQEQGRACWWCNLPHVGERISNQIECD